MSKEKQDAGALKCAIPSNSRWGTLMVLSIAVVLTTGCRRTPVGPEIAVLDVCDVLKNIPLYHGRLIAVRGIYWNGAKARMPHATDQRWEPSALFDAGSDNAEELACFRRN